MGFPIVHFEIVGNDTQKLRDFYRDAFDGKIEQMPAEGEINGGIGAGMHGLIQKGSMQQR